jgi:hypothetical protein
VRFGRDLSRYALWTGRWWVPVVIVALALTALTAGVAKVAVPTVVYTLL